MPDEYNSPAHDTDAADQESSGRLSTILEENAEDNVSEPGKAALIEAYNAELASEAILEETGAEDAYILPYPVEQAPDGTGSSRLMRR